MHIGSTPNTSLHPIPIIFSVVSLNKSSNHNFIFFYLVWIPNYNNLKKRYKSQMSLIDVSNIHGGFLLLFLLHWTSPSTTLKNDINLCLEFRTFIEVFYYYFWLIRHLKMKDNHKFHTLEKPRQRMNVWSLISVGFAVLFWKFCRMQYFINLYQIITLWLFRPVSSL